MIARPRRPGPPAEDDYRLALRRLHAAVDAIRRRWPPRSDRWLAELLRLVAGHVEGAAK
mgnify:CR=1 FL=1